MGCRVALAFSRSLYLRHSAEVGLGAGRPGSMRRTAEVMGRLIVSAAVGGWKPQPRWAGLPGVISGFSGWRAVLGGNTGGLAEKGRGLVA